MRLDQLSIAAVVGVLLAALSNGIGSANEHRGGSSSGTDTCTSHARRSAAGDGPPRGYRFLPDGSGLVYIQRIQALDFWLLDLRTKSRRQLTQLANRGALRTFDITIVFDRVRPNSNIVLIERPNE